LSKPLYRYKCSTCGKTGQDNFRRVKSKEIYITCKNCGHTALGFDCIELIYYCKECGREFFPMDYPEQELCNECLILNYKHLLGLLESSNTVTSPNYDEHRRLEIE